MELTIDFPGGARVDAHFGPYTVKTDQPPMGGGEGSAPTPFAVFLASIGTCAGIYVSSFLRQRGLPTEGLAIRQRMVPDPASKLIGKIELTIELPAGEPEQYREAAVRSAQLCAVKKHLERPPQAVFWAARDSRTDAFCQGRANQSENGRAHEDPGANRPMARLRPRAR